MTGVSELEDCCKPAAQVVRKDCPKCGRQGKPVQPLTVSVFVKEPEFYLHPERLNSGRYLMCETRSCDVVYYNSANGASFSKDQLRVKVWQKEDDPSVPACYCFNNSVRSIREEIERKGSTDVLARINAEVRSGNCRCEVTNPQGSCCLGNVARATKIANEGVPARQAVM
jgi:hypothetical protein